MSSSNAEKITTTGRIRLLPDLVINQISAGEVVDRPASVVRELVDNCVDAGARSISVYIEDGGSALIRVVDDGCGMDEIDARAAFQRHATSKIAGSDDLSAIATLGFRGEALPSIASVARVRLRSQTEGALSGVEVSVNGGVMEPSKSCAMKRGTDIEVRSLFFNTPARKKFLRAVRTEEAKVKTWLRHSAVANPEIHYRYYSEGREVINLPPRTSSVERARELFGGATIALQEKIDHLSIEGLVAHPSMAEGDSGSLILLINGRLVSDRMIMRAVREGFDSTLKGNEYPLGFLSLTIAPHLVDVNVHPQKSEVRFIAPQSIFTLVRSVVRHAVMRFSQSLPQHLLRRDDYQRLSQPVQSPTPLQIVGGGVNNGLSGFSSSPSRFHSAPLFADRDSSVSSAPTPSSIPFSELRFVGQAFKCYLFAEHNQQLYVVDMHAAHERVMFNRIRSERAAHSNKSQCLLVAQVIELPESSAVRIAEMRLSLEPLGFEFREVDGGIEVSQIPAVLVGADIPDLFRNFAQLPEHSVETGVFLEKVDHLIARQACHASIRSGRELEREEAYALFRQMDHEQLANACPHGRPVVVTFAQAEIEQWFGRDR